MTESKTETSSRRSRDGFSTVVILDTESLDVTVEEDREDGVYLILSDNGAWVEVPIASQEEYIGAQRLASALFDAVSRAGLNHAQGNLANT